MGEILAQGDLNGDGVADLVVRAWGNADHSQDGLWIFLANGDGSFDAGHQYQPAYYIGGAVVEDFNRDGNADVLFTDSYGVEFAPGHGDGTIGPYYGIAATRGASNVAAADFNHDGKLDIVFSVGNQLRMSLGNGDGTFGASTLLYTGPYDFTTFPNIVIGDFDGDGKVDIAAAEEDGYNKAEGYFTKTLVLYGNGAGAFTVTSLTVGGSARYTVADLNQDGKSDLVGTYVIANKETYAQGVHILYGSGSRTLKEVTIGSTDFNPEFADKQPVAIADFNGDGRLDLAVPGVDARDGYLKLGMFNQQPDGSFELADTVALAPQSTDALQGAIAGNYDKNGKPDIATLQQSGVLNDLVNTSTGNFPTCSAPAKFGIHVCSPVTGSTAGSPVNFNVAANSFSPIRKIEVWVDGSKRLEKYFSYATYSYLNSSLALASGTHTATVFAVGFDGRLQRKSFSFTGGSGATCSAPSSAGVNICSPTNGSTVGSPVHALAKGTVTGTVARMEVWVDGVKKASSGSNTIDTYIPLAAGSHRFTFFIVNTAGTKWNQVVNATVK